MFSSIRLGSYVTPPSQAFQETILDDPQSPIASSKALKTKLRQLGNSYQAMHLFCSLDLELLSQLDTDDTLDTIFLDFPDLFCRSCVMEQLSKVFAHMQQFDRSYALLAKIPMASQAQSSCYFLTNKMILAGFIEQAFKNIDSLDNLGPIQQSILENSALDQILRSMQSEPSSLLTSIERLSLHFQKRRAGANHDKFWENAYRLCLAFNHKAHAQTCYQMIFSLKIKNCLLQEKNQNRVLFHP